jgi:formate-dependent nitrite reductase membrane component NrfD/ferredoxin
VTICPTVALYRRDDGIVDFDGDRCIGCKSCMQACPYDALYIDPDTQTAAKCNYCAHRVEVGLEPACVIVCPEQAIVAGDLDDPSAKIARLVATEQVQVRKPEQGTRPKVFYLGADASVLAPTLQQSSERFLWAQRSREDLDLVRMVATARADDGAGTEGLSRPVYDVSHQSRPWGWRVAAYLWTKSIAAGVLMVAGLGIVAGAAVGGRLTGLAAPVIAILFLAITTGLLVGDLKRPDRFHYILTKGNRRSWLVWGAWILMAYGAGSVVWLLAALGGYLNLFLWLALPVAGLAAASAGYSAFLFRQAEGRDFWQSPLLLPQLLVAALVAGAAALNLAHVALGGQPQKMPPLVLALAVSLVAWAVVLLAELFGAHAHVDVAGAARLITRGSLRQSFWVGVVGAGITLPLLLLWFGPSGAAVASVLALAGLWIYEDLWVKAGQSIPLS